MKGFVGGIPLALLATAALAQDMGRMETGNTVKRAEAGAPFHGNNGGTAMGGPSGDDSDGGFISPYSAKANIDSNVNEYSKDDHSVKVKDTHVHPPPPPVGYGVALGPGGGPFAKRSYPNGGTAMGGPSGNDEGQVFNMPMTADIHTNVNDVNQDDHHIDVKNKDVHPPPVFAPVVVHPHPHGFEGPPPGVHRGGDHFHVPATSFGKRWGPENGGTAMGGPSNGHSHGGPVPGGGHNGGTAMGGPSGDDDGINFSTPNTANIHSNVNEFSKDDHSVDLKHKDVYPPPHHPAFVHAPPFKRGWAPEHGNGGTAMGGPSGNDGGQTFSQPFTVDTNTNVNEAHKDDHSIDLKHKDVYPHPPVAPFAPFPVRGPGPVVGGPFRRAYAPERESGGGNGGTAMGGPSGDDDGVNFAQPNSVDVNANVNEHHEDNHAIKADTTDVHPPPAPYHEVPQMPWLHYPERPQPYVVPEHSYTVARPHAYQAEEPAPHHAPHEAPSAPRSPPTQEAPAPISEHHETPMQQEAPPQAPQEEQEHTPQCAAQVHEVVHTVTKTQYKEVHPTHTVYQQVEASAAPMEHVAQSSAVPMAHVAQSSADPMAHVAQSSAVPMAHVAQSSAVPMAHVAQTSAVAMPSGADPKMHGSQLASAPAAASTPVVPYHSFKYNQQRPMSSSAAYSMIPVHVPMATPASSGYKSMMTPGASMGPMASGASPLHSAKASGSASASASHGAMFTGAASTISGSFISAAAAVVGVLAFVL